MEFKDQYRSPLWQKKRLECLDSADYQCQRCFNKEAQLHVHHKQYVKGRMIWDYTIGELLVLCDECHETTHHEKDILNSTIAMIDVLAVEEIIGLIAGYCSEINGPASADMSGPLCFTSGSLSSEAGKAAAMMVNNAIQGRK